MPARRSTLLLLACSLACGPVKGDTTGSTSSASTTTTTGSSGGPGHSATGDDTSSTSSTATGEVPTSTEPTTDPGTSSSTSHSWIVTPDGGGPGCPESGEKRSLCDVWTQNCAPDEKCSPTSGGCEVLTRTICTEVVRDPVALGGACLVEGGLLSGRDDCDFGLLCAHVDPDTLAGTCVSFCHGAPDAPDCAHDPGTSCVPIDDKPWLGGLCLPTCDPLAPTCPSGQVCHANLLIPTDFVCLADTSGDAGAAFEPCHDTDCDPGLACVDPGFASECALDSRCCTPFCDLDAPVCPGVGQVCLPYFDGQPVPPGMEDVGLCGLP